MRIALISSSYPPTTSGVSIVVQQLAQQLSKLNQQVIVITSNCSSHFQIDHSQNFIIYRFPAIPNPLRSDHFFPLPSNHKINSILNQFKPNVIHFHDFSPLSLSALAFAKKHHLPIVATHHFTQELIFHSFKSTHHPSPSRTKMFFRTLALIYNRLQTLIVPSQTIAKRLQPRLKIPLTIIPNGVDTDLFKPESLPKTTDFLYVGRLDPEKNLPFLLETFKNLKPQPNLTLIGSGTQETRLKKLAGNNSSFRFLSKQAYSNLPRFYNSARIFITSSVSENNPLTLLEALACGLPVIAPQAGGIPDIIDHQFNGLLVEPNNSSSLIKAITQLTSNQTFFRQLSIGARQSALQFNLSQFINRHLKLYRQLNLSK